MRKLILSTLLLSGLSLTTLHAQSYTVDRHITTPEAPSDFLSSLAIGPSIGTMGAGLTVAYKMTDHLSARAGFVYASYTLNKDNVDLSIRVPDDVHALKGAYPVLDTKNTISNVGGNLMLDFTPAANGFFHLVAGLYYTTAKISTSDMVINPNTKEGYITEADKANPVMKRYLQDLKYTLTDDYYFTTDKQDLNALGADLILGNKIKPYLGIGIGKLVPQGRVGFLLDLGGMYLGESSIESANLKSQSGKKPMDYIKDLDEYKEYGKYAQWFPLINLTLMIRL